MLSVYNAAFSGSSRKLNLGSCLLLVSFLAGDGIVQNDGLWVGREGAEVTKVCRLIYQKWSRTLSDSL